MTDRTRQFLAFDPDAEVDITSRNLPHWFQPGVATFVTLRTIDSLPAEVLELWEREIRDWLFRQGLSLSPSEKNPEWHQLPQFLQSPFRKKRESLFHGYLDSCHGACHLRKREIAECVMKSLWHFNGSRYEIDCAIVMPNHVHLIAAFFLPTTCRKQCTSWQRFTATEINHRIGTKGSFWQAEPFDHLIRSPEQFFYLRDYIAKNGVAANLPNDSWLFKGSVR